MKKITETTDDQKSAFTSKIERQVKD